MMSDDNDQHKMNEIHESRAGTRVSYDPKLSLNTIVVCMTAVGLTLSLIDRMSTTAAATAVMQSKQVSVEQRLTEITAQRFIDRQELLSELREIKQQIQLVQSSNKR